MCYDVFTVGLCFTNVKIYTPSSVLYSRIWSLLRSCSCCTQQNCCSSRILVYVDMFMWMVVIHRYMIPVHSLHHWSFKPASRWASTLLQPGCALTDWSSLVRHQSFTSCFHINHRRLALIASCHPTLFGISLSVLTLMSPWDSCSRNSVRLVCCSLSAPEHPLVSDQTQSYVASLVLSWLDYGNTTILPTFWGSFSLLWMLPLGLSTPRQSTSMSFCCSKPHSGLTSSSPSLFTNVYMDWHVPILWWPPTDSEFWSSSTSAIIRFIITASLIVSHRRTHLSTIVDRHFRLLPHVPGTDLCQHITSASSLLVFRAHLKAHLFSLLFPILL